MEQNNLVPDAIAVPQPPRPKRSHGIRRLVVPAILVLLAALSYRPTNLKRLFQPIPEGSVLATYHKGISSEWHALVRHPGLRDVFDKAGIPEFAELEEEEGIQQTLFWLTGRHSVLSAAPAPGTDLAALLDSLLRKENPDLLQLGQSFRIYGTSAVGWKWRPMELLWHIRYVPGLGKLDVTPAGTRYLVFRNSKTMQRLGLVLSLDIADGVLYVALASDPDAVLELTRRAKERSAEPIALFPATPLDGMKKTDANRVFVAPELLPLVPDETPRTVLDVTSFEAPALRLVSHLPFRLPASPQEVRHATDPLADSPAEFARFSLPAPLLSDFLPDGFRGLFPEEGPAGHALLSLYGAPLDPTCFGIHLPAFLLSVPMDTLPENASIAASLSGIFSSFSPPEEVQPKLWAINIMTKPKKKTLFAFGINDSERPFLHADPSTSSLVAGSNISTYLTLRGTVRAPETSAPAPGYAEGYIDLGRISEFKNLFSVLQLAKRVARLDFGGADSLIERSQEILPALEAVGRIDATLEPESLDGRDTARLGLRIGFGH